MRNHGTWWWVVVNDGSKWLMIADYFTHVWVVKSRGQLGDTVFDVLLGVVVRGQLHRFCGWLSENCDQQPSMLLLKAPCATTQSNDGTGIIHAPTTCSDLIILHNEEAATQHLDTSNFLPSSFVLVLFVHVLFRAKLGPGQTGKCVTFAIM